MVAGAVAVAALAVQAGCSKEPEKKAIADGSNVLLIVMDTLRGDVLGCYGGPARTPNLDRLASSGVLFERAYSHASSTGPSHASLLTSLLPFEHGAVANRRRLSHEHQTLAEVLQASGWHTSAVVSLGVLQGKFGFDQGFDTYGDDFTRDWIKDASEVTGEALNMMEIDATEPYFLWVHYCDPHAPYAPGDLIYPVISLELDGRPVGEFEANGRRQTVELPLTPGVNRLRFLGDSLEPGSEYRLDVFRTLGEGVAVRPGDWTMVEQRRRVPTYVAELPAALELVAGPEVEGPVEARFNFKERLSLAEIRARYALEVEYADRQIGVLLAELADRGLLDDTVVIFASDHGEGLGDHDHMAHVDQLYDTLIRVPLIIRYPGHVAEGLRVDDAVGLADVFPTVTELLQLPPPESSSGRSLVPLLQGRADPERPVFAEIHRPEAVADRSSIVSGGFKYIVSWTSSGVGEELYDLEADPDELHDLHDQSPDLVDRLRMDLLYRLRSVHQTGSQDVLLDEEETARLRALGYVD